MPLLCKPRAKTKSNQNNKNPLEHCSTLCEISIPIIVYSNFDDRNNQLECSLNHFQISIIQITVLYPLWNCYEISTISNFDQTCEARSKFSFSNFDNRNFESFRLKFWFSNFVNRNFEPFRSKLLFSNFDNRNFESFH